MYDDILIFIAGTVTTLAGMGFTTAFILAVEQWLDGKGGNT